MIEFDNSSEATPANTTALTWSHASVGDFMVVSTHDPAGLVTGVTYNGVAMTLVDSRTFNGGEVHSVYKLFNPDAGTHDVVVSRASGGAFEVMGMAASYKKVVAVDSVNKGTSAGTADVTVSTTVLSANCWLIASGYWTGIGNGNLVDELGSNKTTRQERPFNGKQTGAVLADTNAIVGVNSQSITVNQVVATGGPVTFSSIVISIAPNNPNVLFFAGD